MMGITIRCDERAKTGLSGRSYSASTVNIVFWLIFAIAGITIRCDENGEAPVLVVGAIPGGHAITVCHEFTL
jgi:hypothetical protein